MNKMKLTIDGKKVNTEAGLTIFEAAASVGIDIPHLCYQPELGLKPTGACRLCIVEVKGAKGPVSSCTHPVSKEMVVHTDTEEIRQIRRTTIELLLSDHPHDCLTCEKAGTCDLQKYAYELGVKEIETPRQERVKTSVEESTGITYDPSKCILCGRCIAVCHEVMQSGAIDFSGRGFNTRVALPPEQKREESDCLFCGNCIDACPTGALSASKATGKGREWDLKKVSTICPYCGVGCRIVLNIKDNRVVKTTGRAGLGVNQGLLCVKGRFGEDFVQNKDRLTTPLIKKKGKFRKAGWEEALNLVAKRLSEIKAKYGAHALAGLSSAKCTNEENYIMQKFVRAVLGTNNVDHCARLCHASTVAGLARAFGSGAMTNSIVEIEYADTIFVIGSNTTECHPIIGASIKRAVAAGKKLIVADPRYIELADYATVYLPQKPGTDVALINAMMNVILSEELEDSRFITQRTEGIEDIRQAVKSYTPQMAEKITGVPAEDIQKAARIYAQAKSASIIYSMGITQHTTGTDNVLSLANLAMLTGNVGKESSGVNPLRGQNNVQGACDLGALPNVYSGYQKVDIPKIRKKFEKAWGVKLPSKPGLTVVEIMNAAGKGKVKGLYIMGENPLLSDPDVNHVRKALKKLDFLVVQDIFLTETAELADVVLPACGFAEKDGTFTNTERRVQLLQKVLDPPGESRLDWDVLSEVAQRMGYKMSYPNAAEIAEEIASLTPIYGGITHDRLGEEELQWPCLNKSHPGTKFLHKGKFTRGKGKFHAVEFIPAKELPDKNYPFILSTGRILQHFHTGSMSRRAEVLHELVPQGVVDINPTDAKKLSIKDGEKVLVKSRRGKIKIKARVTQRVQPGCVFIAFHFREAPANALTIAALDPVAKIPELKVCAVNIKRIGNK